MNLYTYNTQLYVIFATVLFLSTYVDNAVSSLLMITYMSLNSSEQIEHVKIESVNLLMKITGN